MSNCEFESQGFKSFIYPYFISMVGIEPTLFAPKAKVLTITLHTYYYKKYLYYKIPITGIPLFDVSKKKSLLVNKPFLEVKTVK